MIELLYACDYDKNVSFFMNFFRKNSFDFLLYSSFGLLNTLLLYVYTKSYDCFVRVWGFLRCLPIINLFIYRKLIRNNGNVLKEIPFLKLVLFYLKGKLLFIIVNENSKNLA
jgi:hypothetical protein